MTESELIDTIVKTLINADLGVMDSNDIAHRAIDRCDEGGFTTEAVTDLVLLILLVRDRIERIAEKRGLSIHGGRIYPRRNEVEATP